MSKGTVKLGCFVLFIGQTLILAQKATPPKLIYKPNPEYTVAARRDRVQGIVVVKLNLDTDGVPHDLKIARSLRADLDEKAIEAVSKWRFSPSMQDGKPVPIPVKVEVVFNLYSK
jgi:protein TonB